MTRLALLVPAATALGACERVRPPQPDFTLPDIGEVVRVYEDNGLRGAITWSGNVVEIRIQQDLVQLERGGSLWARVGPYVYLFSPGTREVFARWDGVAAVRVITRSPRGDAIARATLLRTALDESRWRRARALLGHALQEGTERPSRLSDLLRFGEDHTDYAYNPRYVPSAAGTARALTGDTSEP
jgi:hypothetical protein